jgi:aminopeptidase YwaD
VALIVLENPFSAPADELPEIRPTYTAAGFNIPVVHIRRSVFEGLATAEMDSTFDCAAQAELMDSLGTPASLVFAAARVDMNIKVEKSLATGFNIVGVVPGADAELADEYVVVGAHYDHLGIGGPESSTPERYGEIHYGADDNASGVAVTLEVLYQAIEQREQLKRSLLICLFSGEEMGIVGSTALMRQPPVPPEQMYAMFNVDMAGHLKEDTLIVGGLDSALELAGLLAAPALAAGLALSEDRSGLGGSDHVGFLGAEIPSLFFCTGVFPGYHSPDDTPEGINYGGLGRVADMAVDTVFALANNPSELAFNPEFTQVPGPERSAGKLQVSMGTVPHYGGETPVPGMGVGDVTPAGPAELAGITGGDVIVQIMDRRIANIYDFMFVLQDCEPGQTVPVKVWRDGEELEFEVTLAARSVDR